MPPSWTLSAACTDPLPVCGFVTIQQYMTGGRVSPIAPAPCRIHHQARLNRPAEPAELLNRGTVLSHSSKSAPHTQQALKHRAVPRTGAGTFHMYKRSLQPLHPAQDSQHRQDDEQVYCGSCGCPGALGRATRGWVLPGGLGLLCLLMSCEVPLGGPHNTRPPSLAPCSLAPRSPAASVAMHPWVTLIHLLCRVSPQHATASLWCTDPVSPAGSAS